MNLQFLIPSHKTTAPLGKVVVRRLSNALEVHFSILMSPQGQEAEGWRTVVALDASASVQGWYGQALEGNLPKEVVHEYKSKSWIDTRQKDGKSFKLIKKEAYEDAIQKGFLAFSQNLIQPLAQDFISFLAANLDVRGDTTVVYWACGKGDNIEIVGSFTEEQCRLLEIQGPMYIGFGSGTFLNPVFHYLIDRFKEARRSMFVFITDGKLDDLEEVKKTTVDLAKAIADGFRKPVKCVLIGVGNSIDEDQMQQLDDLDTGTQVDIWDHKIAVEMRGLTEIFAELVSENQIVAPSALIYDSSGKRVKSFSDGLPAKAVVTLPLSSKWFELEVAGTRIRQSVLFETTKKPYKEGV
ncbi:MAG: vWA domain-containing protein [bacterium]